MEGMRAGDLDTHRRSELRASRDRGDGVRNADLDDFWITRGWLTPELRTARDAVLAERHARHVEQVRRMRAARGAA